MSASTSAPRSETGFELRRAVVHARLSAAEDLRKTITSNLKYVLAFAILAAVLLFLFLYLTVLSMTYHGVTIAAQSSAAARPPVPFGELCSIAWAIVAGLVAILVSVAWVTVSCHKTLRTILAEE